MARCPWIPGPVSLPALSPGLGRAVSAFQRRDLLRRSLEGALLLVGTLAGMLAAFALAERGLDPGEALRRSIGGLGAASIGTALLLALLHLARGPDRRQAAWAIEQASGGALAARLATSVELAETGLPEGVDPHLVEACSSQAETVLAGLDPTTGVAFEGVRRLAVQGLLLALLAGGTGGFEPRLHLHRSLRFLGPALGLSLPLPVDFRVTPGNLRVLAGTGVEVGVEVLGEVPGELVVVRMMAGRIVERLPVGQPGARGGKVDLGAAHESYGYRFELGPYRSGESRVEVVEAPRARDVELRYRYPAYTRLPDRIQKGGDLDVVAPIGTRVEVVGRSPGPVARAWLTVRGRDPSGARELDARLEQGGAAFSVVLPVDGAGTWTLELEDREGFRDPAPPVHRLVAEGDPAPRVFVLEPGRDLDIPAGPGPRLPVRIHATDGYGIRSLALEAIVETRRGFSEDKARRRVEVPVPALATQVTTESFLDLTDLALEPGDQVSYHAVASDARPGAGEEGIGRSHAHRLRVPHARDGHAKFEKKEAETAQTLSELQDAQKEWERRLDRTLRDVSADGEITWKERRELESLVQEEKELRKRTRELAAEMREAMEEARKSGVLDPEVAEKMAQVQELMRQVADQKMHELLDELRDLMSQVKVDPGKVKELRRKHDREAQSKRLERMVEALKKLKALQDIERVRSETENLAKDQEKLEAETGRREESGEATAPLAEEQAKLEERTGKLLEELDKVKASLGSESASAEKGLEDAKAALEQGEDSAKESMKRAREKLGAQESREARRQQSKAARRMRQAQDSLKQASSTLKADRKSIDLEKVVAMVRLGLRISEGEERLVEESHRDDLDLKSVCRRLATDQDVLYRGGARFEGRFDDSLEDSLELKETFMTAVGDVVENLRDAKTGFEQLRPFSARQLAKTGLEKLNQILAKLLDVQEEMQDEMSAASMDQMMDQLQQMIERQKRLNDQVARLPRPEPGKEPGEEQKGDMQEMSEEQAELRRQLEAMKEAAGKKADGMLGDLGQVSKDMQQVEEALRAMEATEEVRQQQRRIVTRMLDMAQSIQKQGESKERESKESGTYRTLEPPPAPPDLAEVRRRFFENRERDGVPMEDEEAVEGYLDSLAAEGGVPDAFLHPQDGTGRAPSRTPIRVGPPMEDLLPPPGDGPGALDGDPFEGRDPFSGEDPDGEPEEPAGIPDPDEGSDR